MVTLKNVFCISIAIASMTFMVSGCGSSSSEGAVNPLEELFIKAAVYDDNNTDTVEDDSLSIYFNRSIDISASKEELSENFVIDGAGALGDSAVVAYEDSFFHRLKITFDVNSTKFIAGETQISFALKNRWKELFLIDTTAVTIGASKTVVVMDGSRTYTEVNGTVTDDATGLIWQQEDDADKKTWNEAKTYCEDLDLGGLDTWRLPTIDELISLSDKTTSFPSIDTIIFTNTKNAEYWTGSEYLASDDDIWTVNFKNSNTNDPDKNTSHYARCVSSNEPTSISSYTRDNVNEVVLDTSTSMMWEDTANTVNTNNTKTWDEAIDQCKGLSLAGYTDWRLPNINELDSVTDKNSYGPAMSSEFKNKSSAIFWSSTTQEDNSDNAWYTYFYCGCNDLQDKTTKSQVRCVRSAD